MSPRGTRGAYRKEERAKLPPQLQKELVEKAAARHGNCQELAKALEIPKSSVHYYRIGRLTVPLSLMESMLREAADPDLEKRVRGAIETLDRTWANYYSSGIMREMYRQKVRLPTREELEKDDELRRKAAAVVSYVMAEGSIWLQKEEWGEAAANITFADHETDLYEHFRGLVLDVFDYDIRPPQPPGNGAKAIRGFINSRFIAEWLMQNGVPAGAKASQAFHLPNWVMDSDDQYTWASATQPWCDGEGSVLMDYKGEARGFTVGQSRHTDLDLESVPSRLIRTADNGLGKEVLREVPLFGVNALDYISTLWRSEILADVSKLCWRLRLSHRVEFHRAHLKEDGFWSAIWGLRFGAEATLRMIELGLITQKRKRSALANRWKIDSTNNI
jgi:hypothetical protein